MKFSQQQKIFSFYKRCGRDVESEYTALKESETLQPGQLHELQWSRLIETISCAYNHTSYYRKMFDTQDINISDIKTPADLKQIPVMDKQTVRERYNELINPEYTGRTTVYGSSGSTGEPVLLRQSNKALAAYTAAQLRGRSWHGIMPGDMEGKVWGAALEGKALLTNAIKNVMLNRVQLVAFNVTEDAMLKAFEKMRKQAIKYIYGYSSSITFFSRFLESKGIEPSSLELKAVITTSDMLLEGDRQFMKAFWKCPVITEYGAGETGIIAHECEEGNLHITEENVFVEIDNGEVIATPLLNHAMPILRYRLNDAAELKEGPCKCGRAHSLLKNIQGRSNAIVRLPDGRSLHSDAFCYLNRTLMESGKAVTNFQVIQEKEKEFTLLVVPGPSGDIKAFDYKVQKLLGDVAIETEEVSEIPKTASGKVMYVISNLGEADR